MAKSKPRQGPRAEVISVTITEIAIETSGSWCRCELGEGDSFTLPLTKDGAHYLIERYIERYPKSGRLRAKLALTA